MNFNDIVTEVVGKTARPDKIARIRFLVNKAINFCCIEGNFARDHEETEIVLANPESYVHSIDLSTLTRWRKFDYIRPNNRNKYIERQEASKAFVNHKALSDIYYVSGNSAKVNLCTPATSLLVGYYTYPPILDETTNTFWLTDVSPFMIVDKATADLFSEVGNTAEANTHNGLFALAFTSAVNDYKYGVNYG